MTIIDKVKRIKTSICAFTCLPRPQCRASRRRQVRIRATEGKQVLLKWLRKLAESYYAPELGIKTPTWKLTAPLQDRELRTSIQVQKDNDAHSVLD